MGGYSYNKVILMGNLTRDPEIRTLPSGTHVCETGIATSRKWRGQDGQEREETCFIDITIWGRGGEIFQQYKKKGDPVVLDGRLQFDTWQGQDGSKRSKHRVVVENFTFLPRGARNGTEGGTGSWSNSTTSSTPRAETAPKEEVLAGPAEQIPQPFGDEDVPF